jgi:hypothetical protein
VPSAIGGHGLPPQTNVGAARSHLKPVGNAESMKERTKIHHFKNNENQFQGENSYGQSKKSGFQN